MNKKQAKKLRLLNSINLRDNVQYTVKVSKIYKVPTGVDENGKETFTTLPRHTVTLTEGTSKHLYRQLKKETRTIPKSLSEIYNEKGLKK